MGHLHFPHDHQSRRQPDFPYHILCYRFSGHIRINHSTHAFTSVAHDVTLISDHTPYSLHWDTTDNTPYSDWEECWFVFTPQDRWKALLNLPEIIPGIGLVQPKKPDDRQLLQSLFTTAHEAINRNTPHAMLRAENCLEQILLKLAEFSANTTTTLDDRINDAIAFMNEHIHDSITVDDLAQHVHISASRFAGLFKSQMNIAPMQYLEQIRLRSAMELLDTTTLSIQEIGARVGYPNQFHFSTRFRKHTGKSPLQYRKNPLATIVPGLRLQK